MSKETQESDPEEDDLVDEDDSNIEGYKNMSMLEFRNEVIVGDLFHNERDRVWFKLGTAYDQMEKRINAKSKKRTPEGTFRLANNAVSSGKIIKSSQTPCTLASTRGVPSPIMNLFCSYWIKQNKLEIVTDSRSKDVYLVPFKNIVIPSDRQYVIDLSKQVADLQLHDSVTTKWQYMVLFCRSIHRPYNKFIRNCLANFIGSKFDQQSKQFLKRDLESSAKNLNCIIIFDRKKQPVPTLKDATSIVSAVCFSIDSHSPIIYIDYVATHPNFVQGSLASLLMNVAQNFARQNLKIKHGKAQITTYVNCILPLVVVYERYGFKKVAISQLNKRTEKIGHRVYKHFECSAWYDPQKVDDNQHMFVLTRSGFVSRWTNRLDFPLKAIEDEIFLEDLQSKSQRRNQETQHSIFSLASQLSNKRKANQDDIISDFCRTLLDVVDRIKQKPISGRDIADYQRVGSVEKYVYQAVSKSNNYIDFGYIYSSSYLKYCTREQLEINNDTLITREMVKELSLRLIPELDCYTTDSGSDHSMWIELKCKKCKASCFLKKPNFQPLSEFLMKAIFSVWTTHVFGLEMDERNPWNNVNKNWNVCSARTKHYFHSLKHALIHDGQVRFDTKRHESYQKHSSYILSLCDLLFEHHKSIVLSTLALAVDIKVDLKSERECKNSTYVQREKQTLKAIGGTKTLVKKSKGPKLQSKTDIERRRCDELAWAKKHYYPDLELQLKFGKLMLVLPHLTEFDQLLPQSQEYVKVFKASNEYKKMKKSNPTEEPEMPHYLCITNDTKPPTNATGGYEHVIEEGYFENRNEYGKLPATQSRKITADTVQQCREKPNTRVPLKSADKRLIKAHVDRVMCAGDIQSMKLLPPKEHETEVTMYEGKRYESPIRFSGLDSRNVRHLLSDDWLTINFKERVPAFFEKLMNLNAVNRTVYVPAGNRNAFVKKLPFKKQELGPNLAFPQTRSDSCLFCSVASAFYSLDEYLVTHKIMSEFNKLSSKEHFVPSHLHIIDILRNKYREKGEQKLKFNVLKGKYDDANGLIKDTSQMVILVVLSNRHAVALAEKYIFDPEFKVALPRTIAALRFCAELEQGEPTRAAIRNIYTFNPFKR